jgi:hemerythrin-like domain-containing protein
MKPTEDLIHEHNAIKVMLDIMSKIAGNINKDKVSSTKEIEEIVDFLRTFADKCHHGKEENALFPALVEAGIPEENGPIGVMLHEHTIGRGYIKEIDDNVGNYKMGVTGSAQSIADTLLKYVTLLQNHIQKEERILFPMAEKVLSTSRQDEVFGKFEQIEEEVVGHGIHEQYHELLKELKGKYLD